MTDLLQKISPLHETYRRHQAQFTEVTGWLIVVHCGNPEKEKTQLEQGGVLADWSHIEKITLRGKDAEVAASQIEAQAAALKPLQSYATENRAILRLTSDQFMVLCQPGQSAAILATANAPQTDTFSHGGGLGCLVLAGKRRDEVLERSCAMNLRRDLLPPGSVVQTTLHTIQCTLFRTTAFDVLVHSRDYSDSLFEALMDVGYGVGLIPSGIATLPVSFSIS